MNPGKDSNDKASRIPPGNFHLIEHPFQPPTGGFTPIEGLSETVQKLHSQGRLRSALDEIFNALDRYPDHPQALMLAMVIVGAPRSVQLAAQEPLTDAYIADYRLDPIYTVCSKCKANTWVSTNCLMASMAASMTITNPIGLQCYRCGYVVCRDCMPKTRFSMEGGINLPTCPNCHKDKLDVPVYPTGRLPQQMARHTAPVVHVIVFREGPIPPDGEYLMKVLEVASPDALKASVQITANPVSPWPDDMASLANATLVHMQMQGKIPMGSFLSAEHGQIRDEHGARVYIVKVLQPSPEQAKASADETRLAKELFGKAMASMLTGEKVKEKKPGFLKTFFANCKRIFTR